MSHRFAVLRSGGRGRSLGRLCAARLAVAGWIAAASAGAFAQATPPTLEIDFATAGAVPLSPAIAVVIALAVFAMGAWALRRRRAGSASTLLLAVAALALYTADRGIALVSRAEAVVLTMDLTLTASPTILTTTFESGDVIVHNGLTSTIVITAVNYNPGGYDYFVDAPNTTCVPGTVLTSGATCKIRIESLG
jgi:hypothetical protein